MKNIIIPTTFENDTIDALKVAADLKRKGSGQIVLISLSEITDSITDLLFLSEKNVQNVGNRDKLFADWSKALDDFALPKLPIIEHHQYGISRPILIQLLEHFKAEMVIVPNSFLQSKLFIHRLFLRLLNKSEFPVMQLPDDTDGSEEIQRALYLGENGKTLTPALQGMPFHIIHQSMVDSEQPLVSVVNALKINLIVKPRVNKATPNHDVDSLGLPVLTI